ncbi:MAG TPA: glycosyltransferase family 4 protein [Syntrophales bacterium]|nr:glycosyltransferase family 4 protein [Syntrophales bacterium]HOL59130.1 glycosyltransferase family 4 protein [Syntrophales bacterium]HPO36075.1 glycosyltransferase family 4 protein [Syntrophales bacterium]
MVRLGTYYSYPRKVAFVGNFIPRQCGIATFTSDLLSAVAEENVDGECWAVVMNDIPEGYPYPSPVKFEIRDRLLEDYNLAADFLNTNRVDVVCLQHEYGIFGGENGSYVLDLISNLRMPLVTTLHTVLKNPNPGQLNVLRRIAHLSDRLVVMSQKAIEILVQVYGVPREKIILIHHGIPDVPFVDPNYYKDQYGVEGRKVILTFGLLSPGKGIETMIEALPQVIHKHPDVVYIVLGATHPHVRRLYGEAYRLSLQQRARDLGVGDHLIFHNRFVELKELCEYLGAADIYVTPYLNQEQITSGTLAYALGNGKATVSTPYWYAEEMLAEGRGILTPFRDVKALAEAINYLLDHEAERHAMRKRAYTFTREMVWKEVARRYLETFEEVIRGRESRPRPIFRAKTMDVSPREVPRANLDHIRRLTDNVGILQHAKYIVPDRYHGYCTDDNARALIAVLMAQNMVTDDRDLTDLACTYLSFLHHAYNEETGRFRNFMGYDRRWLEDVGSEDSHGRALWGLGEAVAMAHSEGVRAAAQELFEKALKVVLDFRSPRSLAYAIAGMNAYLRRFGGNSEVRRIREQLAVRLYEQYRSHATEDWPWLEDIVAYANSRLAQALIMGGQALQHRDMIEVGLKSLSWLLEIQTDPRGHFVPIGNNGWYRKGGEKARFDQQPIEAVEMIEACHTAYEVTADDRWLAHAQRCMEWFLGRNDLNVPLYDHQTGGCCDGLNASGPNLNQGAESTLSCLLAFLNFYRFRHHQISLFAASGERR